MADKKAMTKGSPAKSRGFDSVRRFIKDVRIELGKVNWPGRAEVVSSTVVVLVAVAFFAVFIGIVDLIFATIIRLISV